MDQPDFPSHISGQSALVKYRGWLTWADLLTVAPHQEQCLSALDPGPRSGYISLRGFRGSVVDRGRHLAVVVRGIPGISTTRHVAIRSSCATAIKEALFEAIAWCVMTVGVRSYLRGTRANTGQRYISIQESTRGGRRYKNLTTQIRATDGSFAGFHLHIGSEDNPAYEELYAAGLDLMARLVAEEHERRAFHGAVDRGYWRSEWRRMAAPIREKAGLPKLPTRQASGPRNVAEDKGKRRDRPPCRCPSLKPAAEAGTTKPIRDTDQQG